MKQHPADAANTVMRGIEDLAPRHIVEAAPDDREEEAREVAGRIEDLYMELDDAMYKVQQITEKE